MRHHGEVLAPALPNLPVMTPSEPVEAATRTACQLTSELTRETARFLSLRLQRYADLELRLARSSGPMAPMDVFMDFSHQTMLDYTRELERLPFLWSRMSEDALLAMDAPRGTGRPPAIE